MGKANETRIGAGFGALGLLLLLGGAWTPVRATFSIVAVDLKTGEVGGAGASCLEASAGAPGGVLVISEILPGKGAIHTQAAHDLTNKQHAKEQMLAGKSPNEIMDWLSKNDVAGTPGVRQYGAVDIYQGTSRSAAFTGANCGNYKGHRFGADYALQGNILAFQNDTSKGGIILDSMQSRFTKTQGTLADRLMAALQGAKYRGADSRCYAEGVSTQSAFLRVAKPTDPATKFYLDLQVPSRPRGMDPIDSLQKLYTKWKGPVTIFTPADGAADLRFRRLPGALAIESGAFAPGLPVTLSIHALTGERLAESAASARERSALFAVPASLGPGVYVFRVRGGDVRAVRKACWP